MDQLKKENAAAFDYPGKNDDRYTKQALKWTWRQKNTNESMHEKLI